MGSGTTISRFQGETMTLAATASIGAVQVVGIPSWANYVEIDVPSATLEDILITLGPKIKQVLFYDASADTGRKYQDITKKLTDKNTSSTSGVSLNAMTSSDFLYVGFSRRARGLKVDVTSANANTATSTTSYGRTDGVWTSLSATDGTISSAKTLAVDGLITWTVVLGWQPIDFAIDGGNRSETAFWIRISTNATLTDPTSVVELAAMANTIINADNETAEGFAAVRIQSNNRTKPPFCLYFDPAMFGALEMTSTSITSAANINWYQIR